MPNFHLKTDVNIFIYAFLLFVNNFRKQMCDIRDISEIVEISLLLKGLVTDFGNLCLNFMLASCSKKLSHLYFLNHILRR